MEEEKFIETTVHTNETLPWTTKGAFTLLNNLITKEFICFEFGSGGSTIWLSRLSKKVFSIEHDPEWAEIVRKRLEDRNITNVELACVSRENDEYSKFISRFNDDYFDFIFVDGRDRVKCIRNSIGKLKPGGVLSLDDSKRERYNEGKDLMRTWKKTETVSVSGYQSNTIFFKPLA